jgi:hypothetical protein
MFESFWCRVKLLYEGSFLFHAIDMVFVALTSLRCYAWSEADRVRAIQPGPGPDHCAAPPAIKELHNSGALNSRCSTHATWIVAFIKSQGLRFGCAMIRPFIFN